MSAVDIAEFRAKVKEKYEAVAEQPQGTLQFEIAAVVTALPPGPPTRAACQLMASTCITVSELSTKLMGRRPGSLTWVPHLKMIVPPVGRLVAPVSA